MTWITLRLDFYLKFFKTSKVFCIKQKVNLKEITSKRQVLFQQKENLQYLWNQSFI